MKRKPYRFFLYLLLRLLRVIIIILPYRTAVFLGGVFGGLAYTILPKYREIALENLRQAFAKEKSEGEIRRIARGVFRNLGMTGAECLSLRKLNNRRLRLFTKDETFNPVREAMSKGRGLIVIGSHFGNWEMAPVLGAAFGFDVTVIGKRIYYPLYDKFLTSIRESKGVKTLYRDEKNILKKSLNVLKANKVLGIVPDQDVDSVDGVFVDFFGKPAYTPTGPVLMAMLSGAPILPVFTVRKKGSLNLILDELIYVKAGPDRKKSIVEYTQKWSNVVEKYIREYPSQWVWMHKRWKTRPENE